MRAAHSVEVCRHSMARARSPLGIGDANYRRKSATVVAASAISQPEEEEDPVVKTSSGRFRSASTSSFAHARHQRRQADHVLVKAEFLEELQALHEDFVARKLLATADEDTSEEALDGAFGKDGSWACSSAIPEAGLLFEATEEPYAVRDWRVLPPGLEEGAMRALLERCGIAAVNMKGCKGRNDRAVGQDVVCVARLADDWQVFCVFDGHGPSGHWPAQRLARTAPYFLQGRHCSSLLRRGKVEAALKLAFKAMQNDLVGQSILQSIDLQISGSTAAVVLRHAARREVWVATVGDSRVALLHPDGGAVHETSDHKPCRPDEAERIETSGGEIRSRKYADGFIERRIYLRNKPFPGLCLTRSMGDQSVKDIGICAEPEVVTWSMTDDEAYLVVCSDGVWEFFNRHDVAGIVLGAIRRGASPQQAAENLLKASVDAWKVTEANTYCDDISIIVASLTSKQAPRWDDDVRCDANPSKSLLYSSASGFYPEATRGVCEVCAVQ